jgi:hypothetical protein
LEKTVDKIIGFQAKESTPTLGIWIQDLLGYSVLPTTNIVPIFQSKGWDPCYKNFDIPIAEAITPITVREEGLFTKRYEFYPWVLKLSLNKSWSWKLKLPLISPVADNAVERIRYWASVKLWIWYQH